MRPLSDSWQWMRGLRPANLFFLAVAQALAAYRLAPSLWASERWPALALLAGATLGLASAGYLINDLHDTQTDRINKPARCWACVPTHRPAGFAAWAVFNGVALLCGWRLGFGWAVLFGTTALLLRAYARWGKLVPLAGNALIAAFMGLSVLLPAYLANGPAGRWWLYAGLATGFGAFRELVKDIEDSPGDRLAGRRTLPLVFGLHKTIQSVRVLGLMVLAFSVGMIWRMRPWEEARTLAALHWCFWLAGVAALQVWLWRTPFPAARVSLLLKLLLFFGLMTLVYPE